ncbi:MULTISPECIES: Grx4 family monothiol glutaredoxin [unclassified Iodidimonas]|uniref:Grx4 family monothiol glutaredoxin n=1 Tax=unclassified Iodidimonas TaxID=2626145 RepID=UPI0004A109BB|nr:MULTISPECIES: Grx4 family monothiol glutaredoxin [unclassified Iodidimonas]GAK33078.1 putative monothiol glutaredoxin ycf64-like [alpha proteobacterium Q-1]
MSATINDRIAQDVKADDVVLFMKGTPVFPQCGFSSTVVQILSHIGVPFKAYDVLSDPELREGIKAYSEWPTIPQLYVKGEFVGGCDIIREMFSNGELGELLEEQGIKAQA